MTKQCRKILSELRKLSNNSEEVLAFLGDTNCFCVANDENKTFDYSKYENEISGIIEQLVNDGYLKYGYNEYFFTITNHGLHPHRYKWELIKHFLLTSILIPIAVSVVTSIIVLLLQGLL